MGEKPLRVLIVGDSENDAGGLLDELKQAGYKPRHDRVDTLSALRSALQEDSWDLILSGNRFSNSNCLQAIQLLKEKGIDIPFIIVSPEISEEMAVEAIKAGAHDCIRRRRKRLIPTIERELRTMAMRQEHERTMEELRRNQQTVQQLAYEAGIVAEIGRLISSTLDIDEVYERFAAEARKLIPFDRLVVNLNKPLESIHYCAYVSGIDIPERRPGDSFPLARSLNEKLMQTRRGLIIEPKSLSEIADRYPSLVTTFEGGMRSMMSVPLISRDEVIGGLHFRSIKTDCYTPAMLHLAERIGNQIAGAIASAQLFKDLKKAEEEQRENREKAERLAEEMAVIAQIGRLIGSTLNIEEVYESFALLAKKLVPFDRLSVDLNASDKQSLIVTYVSGIDIPERRRGATFPIAGTVSEYVLHTRTGMLIHMESDEEIAWKFPHLTNVATARAGLRSLISVPLISRNEVIGTLHFRSRQTNAYNEQDLRLAEEIGLQIAEAIANAQLFQDLKKAEEEQRDNRKAAERLAEEMAVIAEVGRLIGSTLDIHEVYERFAAETRKLIPFDRVAVNLFDLQNDLLSIAYVAGSEIRGRKQGDSPFLAGTFSEEIIRTRTGLLLQPLNTEEKDKILSRFPSLSTTFEAGFLSLMGIPLVYRNDVIGVLHFRSMKANAYNEQDLRLAERIGSQIAGAIANALLFSDLKNTERSLRESEGRFRALFEQMAVGVSENDASTKRYVTVNRRLCEIVGRTEEEMLATTFQAITHPDDRHLHEEKAALMLAGKIGHYNLEKRYVRKDGEVVWADVTVSPLWKPGEPPGYTIAVAQDITGRKRLEEEHLKLEERLRRAEKMEVLGQLAGGVAHDLNNVLGVLVGYSELLLEQIPTTSPLRKYVTHIQQSGEKGAAIIQDLLTLARRGVAVSEVIDLNRIVSDYCKTPEFENLQASHPLVVFKTLLDQDLLNIKGSPVHLNKTLMNLVSNAAEAISGRGEVVIRTENRYLDRPILGYDGMQEGDYAVLTVSDTGKGIAPADLEKIFEPFYTKKVMGRSGTGLGLTVVWGTVKDHRGYIDVQSEEEKGSIFTLYFPVTREKSPKAQEAAPPEIYQGRGESLLVVDDVKEQRELAMSMLTGLGYRVTCLSSGEEAVEYLKANTSDLIVLDMIMDPGIDGLETYRRILQIHPRQKTIIVSGFSETDRVRKAQSLGAGAYVRKPYVKEKIGLAIRKELDR